MVEHVLRHELTSRTMVVGDGPVPRRRPDARSSIGSPLPWTVTALLTRVPVHGLAIAEVGDAARAAAGATPRDAVELRAATGGNAFFLTELIRHTDGEFGGDLPDSVRAMLGVRLDRLDPVVTQVLNLTAVGGRSATTLPGARRRQRARR